MVQFLLPEKYKGKYENPNGKFDNWCKEKKVKMINEESLFVYFEQKPKVSKSSTLWSVYSTVRTILSVENNINKKKASNFNRFS